MVISFLTAKNRVVNSKLAKKSIPTLECQAVAYASEIVTAIYFELPSVKKVLPISIDNLYIYTDSMVTLAWLTSFFVSHEKMQKRSVYVMNRLQQGHYY